MGWCVGGLRLGGVGGVRLGEVRLGGVVCGLRLGGVVCGLAKQ